MKSKSELRDIFTNNEWNEETLIYADEIINKLNDDTLKLSIYPNQYEIVTAEQMLDAYSLIGLPTSYNHWKFGKSFAINENKYKRGQMGLSYEMVINCLKYDSKIIERQKGIIKIENVEIGDSIWNGSNYVKVLDKKFSNKVGCEINLLNNKSIYASDGHLFPVYNGYKIVNKKVSELSEHDYLLLNKHEVNLKNNTDFSDFDYTPTTNKYNKFQYAKYCTIPNKMTKELAELLGIIIGDGSMGHTTTKACDIIIGFPDIENENNYNKYVCNLIKSIFNIEPSIKRVNSKNGTNEVIQIISVEIKEFFNYIGLCDNFTHKNKRVPKSIFNSGSENIKSFIKGIFDTDGSVKNGYIKFSGYNYDLSNDIYNLLNSIGITCKINLIDNKHQKISGIQIPSSYREKYLSEIGSSIPRKIESLKKEKSIYSNELNSYNKTPIFLIEKYKTLINKRYGYSSLPKFIENIGYDNIDELDRNVLDNYQLIKIKHIQKGISESKYIDITVDSTDHLFYSEGIITHNCNPCISYNMEENTTCLMLLVMAHAGIGHNAFFKNNYLFKQWTQADAIIDYMVFAKKFVSQCEEKYGYEEVESVLDACHALMDYGVSKYKKPYRMDVAEESGRVEKATSLESDIWRTVPKKKKDIIEKIERFPENSEENILYFIEKNSPILEGWQRELVRIVRKTAQYFYPQAQTKVINEGCATFTHYHLIEEMHKQGYVDDGFMLEFYHHHSNVIFQPGFDSTYYSGMNPYTLGFNIFMDVKRMCQNPTPEDAEWFPNIVNTDWTETFRHIIENYKDDSFIAQYLSPNLMREMRMFSIEDIHTSNNYTVNAIHNESGYVEIRDNLSNFYNRGKYVPDIQVYDVDLHGDRTLTLKYTSYDSRDLKLKSAKKVLSHLSTLWGFPVRIVEGNDNKEIYSTKSD